MFDKNRLRKYVSYTLGIGGLAHFIGFGVALYVKASIHDFDYNSCVWCIEDEVIESAAYIVKGDVESNESRLPSL